MNNSQTSKTRRITGKVLIGLGFLVLSASAGAKFAHVPKVVEELGRFGFDGIKLNVIAVLEVASAILFLIPFTRSLGLLLASSFLGGAIATHVQRNDSPLAPAVILALIWFGSWLRHPVILWSFGGKECSGAPEIHGSLKASGNVQINGANMNPISRRLFESKPGTDQSELRSSGHSRPDWVPAELFPFSSRWLELDGARLHYVDEGNGPVLLMVAGTPMWSFMYRNPIQNLRGQFRCIAVDLPGFGLSQAPVIPGKPFASSADLLQAFVRRLGLREITLIVHATAGFFDKWKRVLPRHKAVLFPQSGHYLLEDEPDRYTAELRLWLEETRRQGQAKSSKANHHE